jgi:hypothetical protein
MESVDKYAEDRLMIRQAENLMGLFNRVRARNAPLWTQEQLDIHDEHAKTVEESLRDHKRALDLHLLADAMKEANEIDQALDGQNNDSRMSGKGRL